ncbi:hypothetical protein PG995_000039, partial [Apiospora arundinis]
FRASHFVDISPEEVRRGLDAILKNKDTFNTHRFCIFIDGLDEFLEEPENFRVASGLFSSNDFSAVLDLRFKPSIAETFLLRIKDGLETIEGLETRDDRSEILALGYGLVEKAEGVFLWAKLALSTVQESVMSDDSVADMKRKIDSLPMELEEVFQHIFDSVRNHRYETERRRAMLTLQLVLENSGHGGGFQLMRYSFVDDYDNDQHFVLKSQFQSWSKAEVADRLSRAAKQVLRRCFGLVEVTSLKQGPRLTFVHRAVSEFMDRKHASQDMDAFTTDFDTLDFTCQSFLATIKFIDPPLDYYATVNHRPGDHHHLKYCPAFYWTDPPTLSHDRLLTNNLSPDQTPVNIPLSSFQHDLLRLFDDARLPVYTKHRIPESFIYCLVEICMVRIQSGYEVTYGTPEYTYDGDPRACGVAESVLLAICSGGLYWLVQPAILLSQQQSNLNGTGLELLLWYTLRGISSVAHVHAPDQCIFRTLDCLLLACCQGTKGLPHKEMWIPNYWPGLWRRLIWSGFWDARGFMGSTALEPLLRIFLLYGAPPDLCFQVTRYLRQKHCYWMVNSLDLPQHAGASRRIRFKGRRRDTWSTPVYDGETHVILPRGVLPQMLETHLIHNRNAENTFSLHDLVGLWFPPRRAKVLQYLIEKSMARRGPPSHQEVIEMKANRDLDVDIQNGITFETPVHLPRPKWVMDYDPPDSGWEDWAKDAYIGDSDAFDNDEVDSLGLG